MRTHYIVRYSKQALIPGRGLTFRRGDEVPASVNEIKVYGEEEAREIAREHLRYDGDRTSVTKVFRNGRTEVIASGFSNNGYASPEERARLDIGDVLDFVSALAGGKIESLASAVATAQALVEKHNGSCLAKGA